MKCQGRCAVWSLEQAVDEVKVVSLPSICDYAWFARGVLSSAIILAVILTAFQESVFLGQKRQARVAPTMAVYRAPFNLA